jgi:hypothetical protein
MLTAARNANGPRSQRAPPPAALRGCHFASRKIANGTSTSSGRKSHALVITPSPAAAQPIVYQRHDGPSSRCRRQAVQAQRRPEAQRRVDLRLPRLPHELHREQQRQRAGEPRSRDSTSVGRDRIRVRRNRTREERRAAGRRSAANGSASDPARSARRTTAVCPRYGWPPTRGSNQSPVATMSRATSAKRGLVRGHGSRKPIPRRN